MSAKAQKWLFGAETDKMPYSQGLSNTFVIQEGAIVFGVVGWRWRIVYGSTRRRVGWYCYFRVDPAFFPATIIIEKQADSRNR